MTIPTFVISLKEETERRKAIAAHLKERSFECTFFDAIDGRKMDVHTHPAYNSKKRRASHGLDLLPGELGCLLSHQAIYQKIIDDNLDYAFVLEDDARLAPETKPVLEKFLEKDIDFDLLRLLGSPKIAKTKRRNICNIDKSHKLVRILRLHGGAHAQIISKSGAQKLLKALENFAYPIDMILGRCWENGLQSYALMPGLATQDKAFDSAIGGERFEKRFELTGAEKAKYPITRLAYKLEEAAGKYYTYYKNLPNDLAIARKFG